MALVLVTVPALAQEFTLHEDEVVGDKPDYSPFVDRHYPQRVYWGDTHLHTSNSPDAGLVGNTLGPDMAYRFARGEEVTASGGLRVKLIRPLDFLVVADHSEYMGLPPMLAAGDPVLLSDPTGKRWYDMYNGGPEQTVAAMREVVDSVVAGTNLIKNDGVMRTIWERNNATADEFNDPGNFTAFIGYEWTSFPGGNNLHRVVMFRDDASKANQVVPFSSMDSSDVEDFWKYLAGYESKTGGQVLAISHNGNVSGGVMFADRTQTGKKLTREYAEKRMRWEPVWHTVTIGHQPIKYRFFMTDKGRESPSGNNHEFATHTSISGNI